MTPQGLGAPHRVHPACAVPAAHRPPARVRSPGTRVCEPDAGVPRVRGGMLASRVSSRELASMGGGIGVPRYVPAGDGHCSMPPPPPCSIPPLPASRFHRAPGGAGARPETLTATGSQHPSLSPVPHPRAAPRGRRRHRRDASTVATPLPCLQHAEPWVRAAPPSRARAVIHHLQPDRY